VTDPLETRIAQVLAEHEDISFDLGTPRRYTRHGGWNMACGCGFPLGDGGDEEEAYRNRRAHVAAEIAKALGAETRVEWGATYTDVRPAMTEPFSHGEDERTARIYADESHDGVLWKRTTVTIPPLVGDWQETDS